jgi:hypothetical protein
MIPIKIQALFDFIDYLDINKSDYIEKYIPLCNELKVLGVERDKLNPKNNYIDKQNYDKIQLEISKKFAPIKSCVYNPITSKLRELEIWQGDDTFSSIWNNNSSAIYEFKENFNKEDVPKIMHYKNKYLTFRKETNTDFLSLTFVFTSLDEVLKELFDFFKDAEGNEFDGFESKTIKVNDIDEVVKGIKENNGNYVKYSIPSDSIFKKKKQESSKSISTNIKNEFIMGDNINVGNIPNNNGQINIGRDNSNETNATDSSVDLTRKSFKWQKWGVILATVIGIIVILIAILT